MLLGLSLFALASCGGQSSPTPEASEDASADVSTTSDITGEPDATHEDLAQEPEDVLTLDEIAPDLGQPEPDVDEPNIDVAEDVPEPLPEGESCANAAVIDVANGIISGDLTGHSDDHNSSCRRQSGTELVYTFTVDAETRLSAVMNGLDSVLSLRKSCSGADELICDDDGGPDEAAMIQLFRLEAGSYYLFADCHRGEEAPFDLALTFDGSLCTPESCPEGMLCNTNESWTDVVCTCPDGTLDYDDGCVDDPCEPNPCDGEPGRTVCVVDLPSSHHCDCHSPYFLEQEDGSCFAQDPYVGEDCASPYALELGLEPIIRPVGLPEMVNDARSAGCGGKGPDAVFTFGIEAPTFLDATAWGADTILYVRHACEDAVSELPAGCNDDADPPGDHGSHLTIGLEEAGTYYLFVDEYGEDPPENDVLLSVFARPDPCVEGGGCRPDQICTRNEPWTEPLCVCPEGMLEHEAACVDDPCEPWPCTEGDHTWCERRLPDSHACTCRPGYLEDGLGDCVEDPEAAAWTVMVFLNADNNLEEEGLFDVHEEMTLVGSSEQVNVVVELDIESDVAQRLLVEPGQAVEVGDPIGEVNMGDWRELARFGEWAVSTYPARRYALVLWNHGSGWHKSGRSRSENTDGWKSFSSDDTSPGWKISIAEGHFARAMERIRLANGREPVDIVAFDACLMGMWEVAHASVPYGHYFVGSEANIPGSGFSYDDFLAPLASNPAMDAATLATWIVQSYQEEGGGNATLAAVELAQVPPLDTALSELAAALLAHPESYEFIRNLYTELPWYTVRYTDLRYLAERLSAEPTVAQDIRDAAVETIDALDAAVLVNGTNGDHHQNSNGLSIYLTGENYDADYDNAMWSLVTLWDDFLRDFAGVEETTD